jgi:hypothetical protein
MVIWGMVCFTHITPTYPKILWLIIISRFHGGRNTMDSLCPNSNSRKQHCPFGTQSQPIIRHDKPSKQHKPSSTSINHDDPTWTIQATAFPRLSPRKSPTVCADDAESQFSPIGRGYWVNHIPRWLGWFWHVQKNDIFKIAPTWLVNWMVYCLYYLTWASHMQFRGRATGRPTAVEPVHSLNPCWFHPRLDVCGWNHMKLPSLP